MNHFCKLCALEIFHNWYGDSPAPLNIVLTGDCAMLANRQQLRLKESNRAYGVYWMSNSLDDLPSDLILEFEIHSKNPLLAAYTDMGEIKDAVPLSNDGPGDTEQESEHRKNENVKKQGTANLHIAEVILNADNPEKTVEHTDWKKTGQARSPLARLKILPPWNDTPTKYSLRFPSISTYWTYIVDAPHFSDRDTLAVISKDGNEQFKELERSPSANGRTARRFQSVAARQSQRQYTSLFELVSGSAGSDTLISPLPTPSPNAFPHPVPNDDKFESQIFVTVLAKGGP